VIKGTVLGLVLSLCVCGCTVVITKSPPKTPSPTPPPRPVVVYPTLETITPTETATASPTSTSTAAATPTATTAPPTATPSPTPSSTATPVVVHIVQKGETLSEIAATYDVSLADLVHANSIENPDRISVGQRLTIPVHQPAGTLPDTGTATVAPTPTEESTAALTPTSVPTQTIPAGTTQESPTPTPTPPTPPAPVPPRVEETSVTINITNYEDALYPLRPEDVGYPYDGLDFEKLGPPAEHRYKALVLENAYTAVTILPSLGGRIYQIRDKVTGNQLLYNNPSVIASSWGMRGWWLAVGGIEWALPTEEHGLVEYLPWQATTEITDDEASVTLRFKERLTGIECSVRISLEATASYVQIHPSLTNPGNAVQRVQFWTNAAFAPGGTAVNEHARLVFPARQVIVHDTSDPGLPPTGQVMAWPQYGPRDLSMPKNWRGYLGAFASPKATFDFMGAQQDGVGGLLRIFPSAVVTGAKFFGLGDIPYSRYSGADSSYLELWGGWTPTFWQYGQVSPGETIEWVETWYALPNMPQVSYANADAALSFSEDSIAIAVTKPMSAIIDAYANNGQLLKEWQAELSPGLLWQPADIPPGIATISVRSTESGETLLRWPG